MEFKGKDKVNCKNGGTSTQDKVKEQNRICHLAKTAREKMPRDYKSFCMVAAHLVKNAHRFYAEQNHDSLDTFKTEVQKSNSHEITDSEDKCKVLNQQLRSIRTMKRQNRN